MIVAMLDPQTALAALNRVPPFDAPQRRRVLVVGAGGKLGTAVMEQLLAQRRFETVGALVERPMTPALSGFVAMADDDAALRAFAPDTALVVFDRARDAFGREAAFSRPLAAALPALAGRLRGAGVRYLVVVVPHRAGLLPPALQQGLATLDEASVAASGFDQLVFMRLPQAGRGEPAGGADGRPPMASRLALWMLGQLHWMIPVSEQAVRLATVAQVAAALAWHVPRAAKATRVMPARLLWHAAQMRDVRDTVQAWLEGRAWPALGARTRPRL